MSYLVLKNDSILNCAKFINYYIKEKYENRLIYNFKNLVRDFNYLDFGKEIETKHIYNILKYYNILSYDYIYNKAEYKKSINIELHTYSDFKFNDIQEILSDQIALQSEKIKYFKNLQCLYYNIFCYFPDVIQKKASQNLSDFIQIVKTDLAIETIEKTNDYSIIEWG